MPRFIFILLLTCILSCPMVAQNALDEYLTESIEQRPFDDEQYNQLTKDKDYSEKSLPKKEEKELPPIQFEGLGAYFKFIFIALGIGLLFFFLIKALNNENLFGPSNKKIKPVGHIDLNQIEDDLENTDLNNPIQQAIQAGNFPLAIRLYYLAILKELSNSRKIKWKKDKTNGEYLRELAGSSFFADMQKVTLIFERIWYGEVKIDRNDFEKIESQFLKILQTVKSPKH